jgi:energy-coupling factor transport system ATP-binding protein
MERRRQAKMSEKNQQTGIVVEAVGGRYRWVAVTALFLAIGMILRMVSPSVAGISPNWLISMYCIAILIFRPSLGRAAGIGLVAGALCVATSKAIFPYANFGSELLGAIACASMMRLSFLEKGLLGKIRPLLCGLVTTLVSGFVFVTLTKVVMNVPMQVYLYGMLPVVLTVAAVNSVVTQLLYIPASRLFGESERG